MLNTLPTTDAQTSTADDTNTETEPELFPERIDEYEAYRESVDLTRLLMKAAITIDDFDLGKNKSAGLTALKGDSPIADHYVHFVEIKKANADKCKDLDGNLPKYREAFPEPEGAEGEDFSILSEDNCADFGIDPDTFRDGEDPIIVPEGYQFPDSVWYDDDTESDGPSLEEVLAVLDDTPGIGPATLEAAEESLADLFA